MQKESHGRCVAAEKAVSKIVHGHWRQAFTTGASNVGDSGADLTSRIPSLLRHELALSFIIVGMSQLRVCPRPTRR